MQIWNYIQAKKSVNDKRQEERKTSETSLIFTYNSVCSEFFMSREAAVSIISVFPSCILKSRCSLHWPAQTASNSQQHSMCDYVITYLCKHAALLMCPCTAGGSFQKHLLTNTKNKEMTISHDLDLLFTQQTVFFVEWFYIFCIRVVPVVFSLCH